MSTPTSPYQAEKLDRFELARVFGALMWSLSKVINSPEARTHRSSELRLLRPTCFESQGDAARVLKP